jgi:hypothetical protein
MVTVSKIIDKYHEESNEIRKHLHDEQHKYQQEV